MLLLYNIIQETATQRAEMEQKHSSQGQTSLLTKADFGRPEDGVRSSRGPRRKFRELSVRS